MSGARCAHPGRAGQTQKVCRYATPPRPAARLQTVLQQLRLVYRAHKAKRKADVLYDVPLGPASLNTTIVYPQQHTVGEAARQQWAQVSAAHGPAGGVPCSWYGCGWLERHAFLYARAVYAACQLLQKLLGPPTQAHPHPHPPPSRTGPGRLCAPGGAGGHGAARLHARQAV